MKKWVYKIIAKIGRKKYVIWEYSHHFSPIKHPTKQQLKVFDRLMVNNYEEFEGLVHCQTAIGWVQGLNRDLKLKEKIDNLGITIMKDGLFNPHYRTNREDIWVKPEDVKDIYFEMHLYEVKEEKEE